jgi:hypothetical protein
LNFFNLLNPSSRTVTLGSTQLLTERSTRNIPGGKGGLPERVADNLTAICELPSYFLTVLLQLANKNGIQRKKKSVNRLSTKCGRLDASEHLGPQQSYPLPI